MQLIVVEIGNLLIKPGDIVDIDINPLLTDSLMQRVYTGALSKAV